jgi:hypothetical protein
VRKHRQKLIFAPAGLVGLGARDALCRKQPGMLGDVARDCRDTDIEPAAFLTGDRDTET